MNSKNKSKYIQALEAELLKLGKIFIKEKTFYKFGNGDLVFVRPDSNLVVITPAGSIQVVTKEIIEKSPVSFISFPEVIKFFEEVLSKLGIAPGRFLNWSDGDAPTLVPKKEKVGISFDGYFLYLNGAPVLNFRTAQFAKTVEPQAIEIAQKLKETNPVRVGDILALKHKIIGSVSFVEVVPGNVALFNNALVSGEFEQQFWVKVSGRLSHNLFEALKISNRWA